MNWIAKKIYRFRRSINPAYISDSGIRFIFWDNNIPNWLEKFIVYRCPKYKVSNINLISVWGKRWKLFRYGGKKIFFTAENLEPVIRHNSLCYSNEFNIRTTLEKVAKQYGDYMLNDADLSIGFKNMNHQKYLRLPLWITYMVPYNASYSEIKRIVGDINNKQSKAFKDCVVVNRHDCWGMRGKICDELADVVDITYAGKWRNNTDELWTQFKNEKLIYLNRFKFNICPENFDAEDYCSEKIFDALMGGCIPIYAGCNNSPEPNLINENFIIKWNLDGDNFENIKLIKRLKDDDEFYRKWMKQPKLNPYTVDYIYDRIQSLEKKLREVL